VSAYFGMGYHDDRAWRPTATGDESKRPTPIAPRPRAFSGRPAPAGRGGRGDRERAPSTDVILKSKLRSAMSTSLNDGVVFLRPLELQDAPDHLAGEDDEMARWLSGGHSTLADVQRYITFCQENWRTNGPIRAFGVFDYASGKLIGSIEANLAYRLVPGQVNISYGVFPGWRRKGIARRALELMGSYLKHTTDVRQMVVRIECANAASRKGGGTLWFRVRRDL
jgi:RimJ/RimL family protein N-acetyltransferase